MQILSRHFCVDVATNETQSYSQGAYNLVDKKDYLKFKNAWIKENQNTVPPNMPCDVKFPLT